MVPDRSSEADAADAHPNRRIHPLIPVAIALLAVSSTLAGWWAMLTYSQTAGDAARAPERWPASSSISRSPGRSTLVLFLHPLCPCSQATLDNLIDLEKRIPPTARPEVRAVFVGATQEIDSGSALVRLSQQRGAVYLDTVRTIPRTAVIRDSRGREAARFGALTSGYLLLYDSAGILLFRGGITGSRAHAGQNDAVDQLADAIALGKRAARAAPVFGCAL